MESNSHQQPPPSKAVEEIKCRSHPQQIADLFLNDSNETDLFKCVKCLRSNPFMISKVISISSILAQRKDGIEFDLSWEKSGLVEEAESFVDKSNDLLGKINDCVKEIEAKMYEMFQVIKEEFIGKAKSILAQKTIEMKGYSDKCGRQKIKSILEDINLCREQKELQLKQLNGELNSEDNKENISQILTRLRDLKPQISLEIVDIKKDLINTLIKQLSQSFSCGSNEEKLIATAQALPSNNNSLELTSILIAIQMKTIDGGQYIGQLSGEEMHGLGALTLPNGELYIGEWKYGKRSGVGKQTYVDGLQYVGEWKENQRNGQATQTWVNGDKCVGEWKNDKRNGQGTTTWPNGDKYVGEFQEDKRNGQGTYTWPDGEKYVGEFKEHKKNGYGTKTSSNGVIESGLWKDDKFMGK